MAERKRLNLLDLSFVFMETRQTPMHVAGLQTFRIPKDAPPDFTRQLYHYLRSFPVTAAPFTYRLASGLGGAVLPVFEVADRIDLDYHLRHSALPYPGGERELGILVSRLHSNPMDMTRPLWEIHLIEGLQGNRFALYGKLHHSLADGVAGVGLLNYSEDPGQSRTPPVWAAVRPRKKRAGAEGLGQVPALLQKQVAALPSLLGGLAESAKAAVGLNSDPDYASLLEAPRTIFNTNVTAQRRVATQATSLERLKAIGKAADGSLNDVVLAICSAGLRRYMRELDALPSKSLIASIPVALPRDADQAGGNAITFANVRLGTDIDDVRKRFEAIRRSSATGRAKLRRMDQTAIIDYTVLVNLPQMLTRIPGVGARIPPLYNVIISNVPGPQKKIYFLGAEMDAYYPISALAHGQALNITVMSYAGGLFFGFTACHDRVPSIQRLAVYTGEAIDELEAVFKVKRPSPAKGRARSAAARPARKRSRPRKSRAKSA